MIPDLFNIFIEVSTAGQEVLLTSEAVSLI